MEQGRNWMRVGLWVVLATLPIAALLYLRLTYKDADLSNYDIVWDRPDGWKEVPHSAASVFRYKHAKTESFITCSVQRTTADTAILPELDTDGMVVYALATARAKQPQWSVSRMPDVDGGLHRFTVMRKDQPGRTLLQAYCVKGASTVIMTLSCRGPNAKKLNGCGEDFADFLRAVRLEVRVSGRESFGATDDF